MSKALRETKCFRCSLRWNGQANSPEQRRTTPSTPPAVSSRTTGVSSGQGQMVGNSKGTASSGERTTPSTWGMTSAGPLDLHRVADPDAEPGDLLGIVQRRVGHHHASHGDRLEPRPPASARRCGRPGCRWRSALWLPSRPETCGRWPSAGCASGTPAGPAGRAGQPCRRRRRCRRARSARASPISL